MSRDTETTQHDEEASPVGEVSTEAMPDGDVSSSQQPVHTEQVPPTDVETVLGLNRSDRRVVTVLIVIAFTLMSVQWYRLTQFRPQPMEVVHPEAYRFQLDVNSATWVEWMQLDRIGETLARRIVEDREQRGPFASVDDVQRVNGIGPKTLAALRPHLTCQSPEEPP